MSVFSPSQASRASMPLWTEVAREAGVTREALYKSLSEDGDPRLTTLLGVMRALGMTLSAHRSL